MLRSLNFSREEEAKQQKQDEQQGKNTKYSEQSQQQRKYQPLLLSLQHINSLPNSRSPDGQRSQQQGLSQQQEKLKRIVSLTTGIGQGVKNLNSNNRTQPLSSQNRSQKGMQIRSNNGEIKPNRQTQSYATSPSSNSNISNGLMPKRGSNINKIPEHLGVDSEKEHNRTFDSADNQQQLTSNYHHHHNPQQQYLRVAQTRGNHKMYPKNTSNQAQQHRNNLSGMMKRSDMASGLSSTSAGNISAPVIFQDKKSPNSTGGGYSNEQSKQDNQRILQQKLNHRNTPLHSATSQQSNDKGRSTGSVGGGCNYFISPKVQRRKQQQSGKNDNSNKKKTPKKYIDEAIRSNEESISQQQYQESELKGGSKNYNYSYQADNQRITEEDCQETEQYEIIEHKGGRNIAELSQQSIIPSHKQNKKQLQLELLEETEGEGETDDRIIQQGEGEGEERRKKKKQSSSAGSKRKKSPGMELLQSVPHKSQQLSRSPIGSCTNKQQQQQSNNLRQTRSTKQNKSQNSLNSRVSPHSISPKQQQQLNENKHPHRTSSKGKTNKSNPHKSPNNTYHSSSVSPLNNHHKTTRSKQSSNKLSPGYKQQLSYNNQQVSNQVSENEEQQQLIEQQWKLYLQQQSQNSQHGIRANEHEDIRGQQQQQQELIITQQSDLPVAGQLIQQNSTEQNMQSDKFLESVPQHSEEHLQSYKYYQSYQQPDSNNDIYNTNSSNLNQQSLANIGLNTEQNMQFNFNSINQNGQQGQEQGLDMFDNPRRDANLRGDQMMDYPENANQNRRVIENLAESISEEGQCEWSEEAMEKAGLAKLISQQQNQQQFQQQQIAPSEVESYHQQQHQPNSYKNPQIIQQQKQHNNNEQQQQQPQGQLQQRMNKFYPSRQQAQQQQNNNNYPSSGSPIHTASWQTTQIPAQPQKAKIVSREEAQRIRRQGLGLGFLANKTDSFLKKAVHRSKEKIRQACNSPSDSRLEEAKLKKRTVVDSEKLLEIQQYMAYKKRLLELSNYNEHNDKISKSNQIIQNKQNLESVVKKILQRLKKTQKQAQQEEDTNNKKKNGDNHSLRLSQQQVAELLAQATGSEATNNSNNYSFLYDEYKKMIVESQARNQQHLVQLHAPLSYPSDSHHTSHAHSRSQDRVINSHNHSTAVNTKKRNQQIQQHQQHSQQQYVQSQQRQSQKQVSEQQLFLQQQDNELRGRQRALHVRQKFNELSERLRNILQGINTSNNNNNTNKPQNTIKVHSGEPSPNGKKSSNSKTTKQKYQDQSQLQQIKPEQLQLSNTGSVIIKEEQSDADTQEQDYYYILQYLNHSATAVQKLWRGYHTRKLLRQLLEELTQQEREESQEEEGKDNQKDNINSDGTGKKEQQQQEYQQGESDQQQKQQQQQQQQKQGQLQGKEQQSLVNNTGINEKREHKSNQMFVQNQTNQQQQIIYQEKQTLQQASDNNEKYATTQQQQQQQQLQDAQQKIISGQRDNSEMYYSQNNENYDKIVNISTIKSSLVLSSNEIKDSEGQQLDINKQLFSQGHIVQKVQSKQNEEQQQEKSVKQVRQQNQGKSLTSSSYQEELQRLKELEIQKWQMVSSRLQNIEELDPQQRQVLLGQLYELTQNNKQELINTLGNSQRNQLNAQISVISNGEEQQEKESLQQQKQLDVQQKTQQQKQQSEQLQQQQQQPQLKEIKSKQNGNQESKGQTTIISEVPQKQMKYDQSSQIQQQQKPKLAAPSSQPSVATTNQQELQDIKKNQQKDINLITTSQQKYDQQQLKNRKDHRVAHLSNEEIDNVLRRNNADTYDDEDYDEAEGIDPHNTNNIHDFPVSSSNEFELRRKRSEGMDGEGTPTVTSGIGSKQELNQLYLLLSLEANKDKRVLVSSASNPSSHRNEENQCDVRIASPRMILPQGVGLTIHSSDSLAYQQQQQQQQQQISSQSSLLHPSESVFDRDSFKIFTDRKLKELQQNENIEDIVKLREESINMRHQTQVQMIHKLLEEKAVTPRTYAKSKAELDTWAKKEQAELNATKQEFESSLKRAIQSITKTQRDMEYSTFCQINNNLSKSNNDARNNQDVLERQDMQAADPMQEDLKESEQNARRDKDKNNTGNSLGEEEEEIINQLKLKEKIVFNESKESLSGRSQPSGNVLMASSKNAKNKEEIWEGDISHNSMTIASLIPVIEQSQQILNKREEIIPQVKQPTNNNNNNSSESINSNNNSSNNNSNTLQTFHTPEITSKKKDNQNEEGILQPSSSPGSSSESPSNKSNNNSSSSKKEEQHHANNISPETFSVNEVFNTINEEIKEKWKMNAQVEARLNEQLNRTEFIDKSDKYGIPSNLFIIEQYILSLAEYVKAYFHDEFIANINTSFGFTPAKRLKLIHGYDSYVDPIASSQSLEEFTTLPFVLSEDLFIEFEQNIIGNGENEKDQIIKEFQHIHNKAIFDTFNESLNLFRPYFALGGTPYQWSKSEKNIIFWTITEDNIGQFLDKAKKTVIDWASFLCGIINEHEKTDENMIEQQNSSQQLSMSEDKNNNNNSSLLKSSQESEKSPLQSLLESNSRNGQPENEYFAQSREERLSRMLLVEIFENEYKWQLFEDEKAEVLMELSDLVFEELVEELVDEIVDAGQ